MEIIGIKALSFTYPNTKHKALDGIELSVKKGDFVLLCGSSGSGKSTLLRQLKTALALKGERTGEISFCGRPLGEVGEREQAQEIGFVGQDPESMIVTDKVWHELAFALESLGESTASIRRRTAEMAEFFGITDLYMRPVSELSGGQKQLLALASAMTVRPSLLILDEPSAQLDPIAAHEFFAAVARVNRELGITVIASEHRTEEVFPYADRLICLDCGRLCLDLEPKALDPDNVPAELKAVLPVPTQIWLACGAKGSSPLSVSDGRKWLSSEVDERLIAEHEPYANDGEVILSASGISFRYGKSSPDVLSSLGIQLRRGELFGILGGNGSGKSTLLSVLMGIKHSRSGKLRVGGKLLMMPQDPSSLFVRDTLYDDLSEMLADIPAKEQVSRITEIAELCCLGGSLDRHPFDLSGGELQRAALAKLLLGSPDILLLDEPTKGADPIFKRRFAEILKKLCAQGKAVILVSHDIEFCAEYCSRCAMLFGGELLGDAPACEFFGGNCFYTTAASRMSSGMIDGAVTASDVIKALGHEPPKYEAVPPDPPTYDNCKEDYIPHDAPKRSVLRKAFCFLSTALAVFSAASCAGAFGELYGSHDLLPYVLLGLSLMILTAAFSRPVQSAPHTSNRRPYTKRSVAASALSLTLIPITVYVGAVYLNSGKYLFVSLLVMLEAALPFYFLFEGRSPRARELVTVAVLTAAAVAGRLAFYMLPQFKPVLAVVVISGAGFGANTGFLVGSLSMLLSNFIFGQGPWTPWQMFSMGLIGAISGLLFAHGLLPRRREIIAVFGFLSAVVIYGGIVNSSSLIIMRSELDRASLIAVYAAGFPLDVIHGAASLGFLYVLAPSILKKLDRLRCKYEFFE